MIVHNLTTMYVQKGNVQYDKIALPGEITCKEEEDEKSNK